MCEKCEATLNFLAERAQEKIAVDSNDLLEAHFHGRGGNWQGMPQGEKDRAERSLLPAMAEWLMSEGWNVQFDQNGRFNIAVEPPTTVH